MMKWFCAAVLLVGSVGFLDVSCSAQEDFLKRLVDAGYAEGRSHADWMKDNQSRLKARNLSNIETLESLRKQIARRARINPRADETSIIVKRFVKTGPLPPRTSADSGGDSGSYGGGSFRSDAMEDLPEVIWFHDSRSRKEKFDEIDAMTEQLKKGDGIEPSAKWIMPEFTARPQLGIASIAERYGRIQFMNIRVFQVVDETSFLAQFWGNYNTNPIFLVRGFRARAVVDNEQILLDGMFADCTETYSYETTGGGSNTVRVVQLYDRPLVMDYIVKHVPAADRVAQVHAAETSANEPSPRTWTDSTGSFKLQATLVGSDDSSATLRKADGSELTLPLTKLSDADVAWIKANADKK